MMLGKLYITWCWILLSETAIDLNDLKQEYVNWVKEHIVNIFDPT